MNKLLITAVSVVLGTALGSALFIHELKKEAKIERNMEIRAALMKRVDEILEDYEESKAVKGQA